MSNEWGDLSDSVRVLVTGFSTPFMNDEPNTSWIVAKQLNNHTLTAHPPAEPMVVDQDPRYPPPVPLEFNPRLPQPAPFDRPREVHITSCCLPSTYDSILEIGPKLHGDPSNPPTLPPLPDNVADADYRMAPPPDEGYDFIFHIGQAGRGVLRMERIAHRIGYRLKDFSGQHAPLCESDPPSEQEEPDLPEGVIKIDSVSEYDDGQVYDGKGYEDDLGGKPAAEAKPMIPRRGFDKGYDNFADEIHTAIDVERLVGDMKATGIKDIYSSLDAGHHISDFTFYCSLAQAKKAAYRQDCPKRTKVLFMHIPADRNPLRVEDVIEHAKKIIEWVCVVEVLSPEQALEQPRVEMLVKQPPRVVDGPNGSGSPPPPDLPPGSGPGGYGGRSGAGAQRIMSRDAVMAQYSAVARAPHY